MYLSTARLARTASTILTAARERRELRGRERAFGTGYGNSSGYAADRRYIRDWGNARFRFA